VAVDFDALYRSHYRRVFGLCRKLLGRHGEAQDAAQEVFVRAYRAIDRYDAREPFGPWILGIASHFCNDRLRRRSLEPVLFDDPENDIAALEAGEPAAAEIVADGERAAALSKAIAALPDKYRVPIVLAYFNEMTYDEIAAALDVTRTHVGVLLLRAKKMLRRTLAALATEPAP
jgi:RNA polymerase sigma-70 factor (ECF subfamily)